MLQFPIFQNYVILKRSTERGNFIFMKKRESFNSRWGFILACIGSAVGMGNIWMFPTRVSLYGGGSFLIPYFIFVALIGFTGVIGEMSFGRGTRSGPIDAFGMACETRGRRRLGETLGWIPVIGALAMAIGYTVVMGWIFRYMLGTFTGSTLAPADIESFGTKFGGMYGVGSGIEKANKVMMPIFFILFVILGIYVAFQPGAAAGYRYIFRVEPEVLAKPSTWIFALGQAFFSLSVAGNGTLIYGSYLPDSEDIPASAARVALFDTLAAMLAALVIIPAMATTGAKLDQGGPGLLFIYLPHLIKTMPGGRIIAIIFFVAVFLAGMTSLMNLYEAPIATVQEKTGLGRISSCMVIAMIGVVASLLIQGIVSDWMDVLSIYICPLGAGFAGIMFFWIFGAMWKVRSTKAARNHSRNIFTRCVNIFIFRCAFWC